MRSPAQQRWPAPPVAKPAGKRLRAKTATSEVFEQRASDGFRLPNFQRKSSDESRNIGRRKRPSSQKMQERSESIPQVRSVHPERCTQPQTIQAGNESQVN